jgi:putative sterol carrier protein
MLERYAHKKGKYKWCEKTTLNIDYLSILNNIFPDGKFICLYRNCLDVINSCINRSSWGFMPELTPYVKNNPDNFVAAMAESWLEKNQKLFSFEQQHQDQCFRLTYESLVTEPNRILSSLFEFLGFEWDAQLLDKVFITHHDYGDGDTKILFAEKISQSSIGKGGRIPLSKLQEDLSRKIDILHNALGYQSIKSLHAQMIASSKFEPQAIENSCDNRIDLSLTFECNVTEIISRKDEEFRLLNCICMFVIPGEKGGAWCLNTTGENVTFQKSKADYADCIITTSYQTFFDLFKGDKNPIDAYEQKDIHVDGDLGTALHFGELLFSQKGAKLDIS